MNPKIKAELEKIKSQWDALSQRDRIIVLCLLIIVPLALYAKLIALPLKENIDHLFKEKVQKEQELKRLQIAAIKIKKIREEYNKVKILSKEAEKLLPTKAEIASFLENIDRESEKFNVSVSEIKVLKEENKEIYKKIPLALKLEGNFNNIMLFIDSLRLKDKIITPTQIRLTKDKGYLRADCTLLTFRTLTEEEIKKLNQNKKKKRR
ncbi:hypothetical protein Thein_0513 [Thermodesulfatator indicus DSM 15286]|uniref:Pilus assembly protein PilO n=1 Tax=Thermodesulfatator indicus (strain DSM 15286 / JCM 11887 / CIR29812) TaxID=667014 RepID=F8A873_THEID|nr:type 4a pilus biogenesis protein PilO [Thermodesulfatator indicus]AEH44395.1 hypothetical protein Thein_0513 [Thermodesulfatator indicus DSM 15286]